MSSNFTDEQVKLLEAELDPKRFKHRQGGGGSTLTYLAGFDIIATANRIMGFGSWGYDLISNELVNVTGENGEVVGGYYAARVKVQVYGCMPITEEGVCAIQAGRNPRAIIDAHDMARKGAITDAMKRAFRCFGNQFGNPLYDKDYDTSSHADPAARMTQNPVPGRPVAPSSPAPTQRVNQPQIASKAVTTPPPIAAPLPPKVSLGIVVLGESKNNCPKCAGPMDLLKVVGESGSTRQGERCIAKGCGFKRWLEQEQELVKA